MSDDKIMCIVNAPRIEIVHLPDGTNVNLKLDGGPFDVEAGTNLLAAIATAVGEKYAPSEARGAEPLVTFDAKLRKH